MQAAHRPGPVEELVGPIAIDRRLNDGGDVQTAGRAPQGTGRLPPVGRRREPLDGVIDLTPGNHVGGRPFTMDR